MNTSVIKSPLEALGSETLREIHGISRASGAPVSQEDASPARMRLALDALEHRDANTLQALKYLLRVLEAAPEYHAEAAQACVRLLTLSDRPRLFNEVPLVRLWEAACRLMAVVGQPGHSPAFLPLLHISELSHENDPMCRSLSTVQMAALDTLATLGPLPTEVRDTLAAFLDGRLDPRPFAGSQVPPILEHVRARAIVPAILGLPPPERPMEAILARLGFVANQQWRAPLEAALPGLVRLPDPERDPIFAWLSFKVPKLLGVLLTTLDAAGLSLEPLRGAVLAQATSKLAPDREAVVEWVEPFLKRGDRTILLALLALQGERNERVRAMVAQLLGILPPALVADQWEALQKTLLKLSEDPSLQVQTQAKTARRSLGTVRPPVEPCLNHAPLFATAPDIPCPPLQIPPRLRAQRAAPDWLTDALDRRIAEPQRRDALIALGDLENADADAIAKLSMDKQLGEAAMRSLARLALHQPRAVVHVLNRAEVLDEGALIALQALPSLPLSASMQTRALELAVGILKRAQPAPKSGKRWDLFRAGACAVLGAIGAEAAPYAPLVLQCLRFETVVRAAFAALERMKPLPVEVQNSLALLATGPQRPAPHLRAGALRVMLSCASDVLNFDAVEGVILEMVHQKDRTSLDTIASALNYLPMDRRQRLILLTTQVRRGTSGV